jgi:hypothetical protein
MASGSFFDGMTLVRLAPVITTTTSLWFSVDQYLFLDTLLLPQHVAKSSEVIPSYFKAFFARGIIVILTVYPLTIAAGITNLYTGLGPASYAWYMAGTALAAGHFAFIPAVSEPITALTAEDETKVKGPAAAKLLRRWLNGHTLRSIMVDLPSWMCFVVGTLKALSPS